MNYSQKLEDGECRDCGEEDLWWWRKDETENTIEVYMDCENCGKQYPKEVVNKGDDTSTSALEKILRKKL